MKKLALVVDEKKLLRTLSWILDTPLEQVKKSVAEARDRIKRSGMRHWPPETDDENLVSLYGAVMGDK